MDTTPGDGKHGDTERPVHASGLRARHLAASFLHAFRGLRYLLATQRNARIHLLAAALALAVGLALSVPALEMALVLALIGLVMVTEALNTSIEVIVDRLQPHYDGLAARAKDLAAAGVLVAALTAVVVGLLVYGPRLAQVLRLAMP